MSSAWVVLDRVACADSEVVGVCVSKRAADAYVERQCELVRREQKRLQECDRACMKEHRTYSHNLKPATDRQVEAAVKRYRQQLEVEEWPLVTIASAKTWEPE